MTLTQLQDRIFLLLVTSFLEKNKKNEKGLPQKVKFSNNRWELDITST